MKTLKRKNKTSNKVSYAIIEGNRVICPRCGNKEEFAPAYDHKEVELNGKKLVQFFVRCIHKTGEDTRCDCCSTYLLDLIEEKRYAVKSDDDLEEVVEEE